MTWFTQQFGHHLAIFTLPHLDAGPAVWTVELCGRTRTFTFDEWLNEGDLWALRTLHKQALTRG